MKDITEKHDYQPNPRIRYWFLVPSLIFLVLAFFSFSNNQFTYKNLFFWISGIALFIFSIWQSKEKSPKTQKPLFSFYLVCFLIVLITGFFRFHLLNQVPGEMFSDHAEKLLDVMDILDGKAPIFFIRNTGREALQFYLTAAIIKIFKTGISFTSLKLGTVFLGYHYLTFYILFRKAIIQ